MRNNGVTEISTFYVAMAGSGVRSPQWLWLRAKADNRAVPSVLAEFFSACVKIFWKVKYVFVAPITFEHVYFLELVPSVVQFKKSTIYK